MKMVRTTGRTPFHDQQCYLEKTPFQDVLDECYHNNIIQEVCSQWQIVRTRSNETIRGHDEKSRHDARRCRTEIVLVVLNRRAIAPPLVTRGGARRHNLKEDGPPAGAEQHEKNLKLLQ